MKNSRQPYLALLLLSFLTAALAFSAGCNRPTPADKGTGADKDADKKTPAGPLPPLVQMSFTHKIETPGEIRADEQTRIFAQITGYVKKVHKDIGDPVKPGDSLAELSVPDRDEELKQKKELVTQAKAELERAKKLHAAAEANVKLADAKVKEAIATRPKAAAELTRAESTYDRLKKNSGVIADEAIAETRLGFESAKALVAEVEARIQSAQAAHAESTAKRATAFAEIAAAAGRLRVAEAAERVMVETLKYATITAPYAGVVLKRSVDLGDLVQSSAAGNKGEPLFIVARMNPVRVHLDVPENDAVLIVDGKTRASVRVQALKGEGFQGSVTRSSWGLDLKGRILRAEIDLPNPDGRLRPGMYAYATITVVHPNVWAVPRSAVVWNDDGAYLFLEDAGKARRTAVVVGLRDDQYIEIVKKQKPGPDGGWQQLSRDDKVITMNVSKLTDGQAIEPGPSK